MSVFGQWYSVARRFGAPVLVVAGVVAGLVACGGGTSQVEKFTPARLIVFGDENSLLVNDGANNGKKFSVNGLDAALARDCLLLPIWVQALTTHYNMVFAECNKAAASATAFMRARAGASVEHASLGMAAQLAAQAAAGGAVAARDLAVVMLGANDLPQARVPLSRLCMT
jgi:outer membrane lipase/esterase